MYSSIVWIMPVDPLRRASTEILGPFNNSLFRSIRASLRKPLLIYPKKQETTPITYRPSKKRQAISDSDYWKLLQKDRIENCLTVKEFFLNLTKVLKT